MAEAKLSPPLQTALEAIDHATNGMTSEQMAWHPAEKWSAAGILEHLSLAYARTVDRMKSALQEGTPEVRRRTFREWAGGLIVLKLGQIPPGRKAPEALSPQGVSPDQALESARTNLAELDRTIDQCQERFGSSRNVLVHTILGPLSISEWRRFHSVHTLHHMRQINALRESMKAAAAKSGS
jgi:DinB superfamily